MGNTKKTVEPTIDTVIPDSVKVTIAGEDVEFKEFTMRQLKKVYEIFSGIDTTKLVSSGIITPMALMASMDWEDLTTLLAYASNKDKEFFENLNTSDGLKAVTAFVKANSNFFVSNLEMLIDTAQFIEQITPILEKKVESLKAMK